MIKGSILKEDLTVANICIIMHMNNPFYLAGTKYMKLDTL